MKRIKRDTRPSTLMDVVISPAMADAIDRIVTDERWGYEHRAEFIVAALREGIARMEGRG